MGRLGPLLVLGGPHHWGPRSPGSAIFGVICLLGAFVMVFALRQTWVLRRRGIDALGTVIDHVPSKGGDDLDRAVIAFTDRQGHQFTVTLQTRKLIPTGERLPLVYLP